jgi:hypothetical protein
MYSNSAVASLHMSHAIPCGGAVSLRTSLPKLNPAGCRIILRTALILAKIKQRVPSIRVHNSNQSLPTPWLRVSPFREHAPGVH